MVNLEWDYVQGEQFCICLFSSIIDDITFVKGRKYQYISNISGSFQYINIRNYDKSKKLRNIHYYAMTNDNFRKNFMDVDKYRDLIISQLIDS